MVSPTTAEARISLTIPAKAEYLVCFRLLLTGLARAGDIDEETLSDLKLAVTEACANSVRHAYGEAGGGGHVTGRFELSEDYVAIEVEDDGSGFEFESATPAESPPPGLGLSIIQALAEDFRVSPGPGGRGSRVSFRKPI
jgi:serine/threonine-protein kinase RsbW